jgi:hypothetical protein
MKYLFFLTLMSICFFGHGQKMKLGFRSGVSFSNFYSHQSPGEIPTDIIQGGPILPNPEPVAPSYYYETDFFKDMRTGFFSSVDLQWEIKKRLYAEAGLGYTQKGIDMDYHLHSTTSAENGSVVETDYRLNRNLRLDYITIPLTLQYKLGKQERFYILGGLYNAITVNFLLKETSMAYSRRTFNSSGAMETSTESKSWMMDAYANIFDFGLLAGFGVNWPLTQKMNLGIDIRSSLGLMSIPAKYEEYGFLNFSETAKNISFETGAKLQYILK